MFPVFDLLFFGLERIRDTLFRLIYVLDYFIVWILIPIDSRSIRGDQRPDNGNDPRANSTFCQQLKLQLFNAEHLVVQPLRLQSRVVKILMLRFVDLQAQPNRRLLVHRLLCQFGIINCDLRFFTEEVEVPFCRKGTKNVLVVFLGWVVRELVRKDHDTLSLLDAASLQGLLIQSVALDINHFAFVLRQVENFADLVCWIGHAQDDNVYL